MKTWAMHANTSVTYILKGTSVSARGIKTRAHEFFETQEAYVAT
jgi:hypothetical protein